VKRLVLWDVDGTLVSAGPAAREAFYRAIGSVLGREAADRGRVHMSGKTDPQIALEILATIAVSERDARRHLPAVLRALEENLEQAVDVIRADGRVMPGAEELLRRLDHTPGVVQTVLSGNLRPNARLKVAAFGLDRWLDLDSGAYGSDAEDRAELVPIAIRNVEGRHGIAFDRDDVWVIGDTPRDLHAARAGGVRCLLVGTGRYGFEQLRRIGADAVLPDLTDNDAVLRVVLDGVRPD
jgi:phosphoglycolate phosphatase